MRSPYMVFVKGVTHLVDGEFPKHFDSNAKRQIQSVLSVLTISYIIIGIVTPSSYLFESGVIPTSQVEVLTLIVFLGTPFLISHIAAIRRVSLEEHALQTSLNQVASLSRDTDVVQDVVVLYDYMKVFFALFLVFTSLQIPGYILGTHWIQVLHLVTIPYQLYYLLLFLVGAFILGGRWGRQHINNDADETTTESSDTN